MINCVSGAKAHQSFGRVTSPRKAAQPKVFPLQEELSKIFSLTDDLIHGDLKFAKTSFKNGLPQDVFYNAKNSSVLSVNRDRNGKVVVETVSHKNRDSYHFEKEEKGPQATMMGVFVATLDRVKRLTLNPLR